MFNERKVAQMAAFLLGKGDDRMPHLKLMKPLYLADREAMERYGFPISGDCIVAHVPRDALARFVSRRTGEICHRLTRRNILNNEFMMKSICSKPIEQWTADEFNAVAIIVLVKPGRGKTGKATTGKHRYLIDDEIGWHQSLSQIREEGARQYVDAGYDKLHAADNVTTLSKEEWAGRFVAAVLTHYGDTDVAVCRGDTGRPFILVNTQSKAARHLPMDSILRIGAETYGIVAPEPVAKRSFKP